MLLADHQILSAVLAGEIKLDPFDSSLINPASLDVRLGNAYTEVKPKSLIAMSIKHTNSPTAFSAYGSKTYGFVNPLDSDSFENKTTYSDSYLMKPGETVLASMYEHLTLSSEITAKISGKSSLARLGLANSYQAGLIDCAWSGKIVFELTNLSSYVIKLTEGMKIGQLLFFKHQRPERDYSQTGRYFGQTDDDQGSKGVSNGLD